VKKVLSLTDCLDALVYSSILIFVCSIESIFLSSSNSFLEIDLWVVPLVYFFLHRDISSSFLLLCISSLAFSGYTGSPIFQILISSFCTLTFVILFRSRSYVSGSPYLYLTSLIGLLVFYFSHQLTSYIFYSYITSISDLLLLAVVVLISPGFAFIVEPLLKITDRLIGVVYPFGFEA